MSEPKPNVYLTNEKPLAYRIRNQWEWATIYINPFKLIDREQQGAEVMINSSYGVYGYCWSHMGRDWRGFLISVDRDYAMRKMCPPEFYEKPLDAEEFTTLMLSEIDQWEKDWLTSWETIEPQQAENNRIMREALEDPGTFENEHPSGYFKAFDDAAAGIPYLREMYECRLWKVNPQVVHFWENIWIPFTELLKKELIDEQSHTDHPA